MSTFTLELSHARDSSHIPRRFPGPLQVVPTYTSNILKQYDLLTIFKTKGNTTWPYHAVSCHIHPYPCSQSYNKGTPLKILGCILLKLISKRNQESNVQTASLPQWIHRGWDPPTQLGSAAALASANASAMRAMSPTSLISQKPTVMNRCTIFSTRWLRKAWLQTYLQYSTVRVCLEGFHRTSDLCLLLRYSEDHYQSMLQMYQSFFPPLVALAT